MFPPVQRKFSTKRENFSLVSCPPPPPPRPPSPRRGRIDSRVTASRSRRLRVLLTGRHGNLATSLQWPKVDGLRAGAPEQTEQKSVHARTRNRTCYARRSLCLFFSPLSPSRSPRSVFFFSLSLSPLAVCRFPDRVANYPPARGACRWWLCLVPGPPRLPGGDALSRGSAVDSDIMEWLDRPRSRWDHCGSERKENQAAREPARVPDGPSREFHAGGIDTARRFYFECIAVPWRDSLTRATSFATNTYVRDVNRHVISVLPTRLVFRRGAAWRGALRRMTINS